VHILGTNLLYTVCAAHLARLEMSLLMRILKGLSKALKSHSNQCCSQFSNPMFSEYTSKILPLHLFGTDSLWFMVVRAVSIMCCVWGRGVPTLGGTYYLHSKSRSTSCVSCLLFFVVFWNVYVIFLIPFNCLLYLFKRTLVSISCRTYLTNWNNSERSIMCLHFFFFFRTSDLDSTTSGETWPTVIQTLIYFIKKLICFAVSAILSHYVVIVSGILI
jgi:hypothetical protein